MQLSVIILNYNVRYFLELCVLSVQKSLAGIDSEIIVVDNNSKDESCQMMKSRFPDVILIENFENCGFPRGNNIGVTAAKGEYVCILNPDTVVAEDTFGKLLSFAHKQSNLGVLGCKLIDGTGRFLLESKRGIPTPFVAFTKITGLYKLWPKAFGRYYAQHLSQDQTGQVEILVGALMILKKELYIEVGGFDENCFMYSDDIDLSYMILQRGKSNYYFHETSVIHYKGESTIKDGTYLKRFREAMNYFYKKHFSVSIIFSAFMNIGIGYFSIIKMVQGREKIKQEPALYILVSNDEVLREKIEMHTGKQVVRQVHPNLAASNGLVEIIFDASFLDMKFIIGYFEQLKSANVTFKIFVRSANFMIGSDSSFDRGEIVVF